MYPAKAIIEVHHAGLWHPAAELQAFSHNRVRFNYLDSYVFGDINLPVSLNLPVGLWPEPMMQGLTGQVPDHRPPSFLYDLVPQGQGRKFLLSVLNLPDSDDMVMPLLMAGAFNPIGCLRLNTAMHFFADEARKNPDPQLGQGVSLDDITQRSDEFLNHIALHAMLATGTTGVQGVAPKFLLTTDRHGRWFADMALPDELAHAHWLVKLPRGKSEEDRSVLRNEAAYLRVADTVGLRCAHAPVLHGDMLFLRRFDRIVLPGGGVQRTPEGFVQLTPLFDFAPMFKDPEVVPRSCHWRDKAGVRQADWHQVIEQLEVPDTERTAIAAHLAEFAKVVARLEVIALDCGVDRDVIEACAKAIEIQARQLADLAGTAHG